MLPPAPRGSAPPRSWSTASRGPTMQFHDYLDMLRTSGLFSSLDVI